MRFCAAVTTSVCAKSKYSERNCIKQTKRRKSKLSNRERMTGFSTRTARRPSRGETNSPFSHQERERFLLELRPNSSSLSTPTRYLHYRYWYITGRFFRRSIEHRCCNVERRSISSRSAINDWSAARHHDIVTHKEHRRNLQTAVANRPIVSISCRKRLCSVSGSVRPFHARLLGFE